MRQQLFTMANNYRARAWRDAVGPYTEGMILGGLNVDATTAQSFVHKFKQRLGYIPGYQPAEFYDVLHMVAFAIGKAGYDGDGIRDAVATLRDFPSVMGGKVSMGADHYTRPPLLQSRLLSAAASWSRSRPSSETSPSETTRHRATFSGHTCENASAG